MHLISVFASSVKTTLRRSSIKTDSAALAWLCGKAALILRGLGGLRRSTELAEAMQFTLLCKKWVGVRMDRQDRGVGKETHGVEQPRSA